MMSIIVDVANLAVSTITALAATYLALTALRHSAKPRIVVVWMRGPPRTLRTSTGFDDRFIFDVINKGHWYAKPPARDIVLELRCPSVLHRVELLRGGVGGKVEDSSAIDSCPGPDMILKSQPFSLFARERAKFALMVDWWSNTSGNSSIEVRAYSPDGATYARDFPFEFEE